jgi:NTE family protein
MSNRYENSSKPTGGLALSMSGGGARAVYQVGLLRCIARHFPDLEIPYITGLSAGSINAAQLAAHRGSFKASVDDLTRDWLSLTNERVYKLNQLTLLKNAFSWGIRFFSGKRSSRLNVRGLLNSNPLREYLQIHLQADSSGCIPGIQENIDNGSLQALAIPTTNYMTGQSITWTQGRDLKSLEDINRRTRETYITVEHVMASAALPILFPAIKLDGGWYGDGGIRLYAPLSPAVHLGADKILAISTRYNRTEEEEHQPMVKGYPPPTQIFGVVMNAVFLDLLDQDVKRLERTNAMLQKIPEARRDGKRLIDLFVLRPSKDLGKLAREYEEDIPSVFRFLMQSHGLHEQSSPDWLSMILFQYDYLKRLIELGEQDAERRLDELAQFFEK